MADSNTKKTERSSRSPKRVDRHRDRGNNRAKPYGNNRTNHAAPNTNRTPPFNRVFISNIPFEEKWQTIKDLLREKVGEVTYVEVFTDQNGRSRGYGVVEFPTKELAEKCIEKMHKYEINKRAIIVKSDYYGDVVNKALFRDGPPHNSPRYSNIMNERFGPPMPNMPPHMPFPAQMGRNKMRPDNGLDSNPQNFVQDLMNTGPLGSTVFVANLDYKVTYSKLKEVFGMAGTVDKVDLWLDNKNKSRGMATITFENNVAALQAISMFHGQKLFDRAMVVRMDKDNAKEDQLPSGLESIGPALPVNQLQSGMNFNNGNSFGSGGMSSMQNVKSSLGAPSGLAGLGLSSLNTNRLGDGYSSGSIGGLGSPGLGSIGLQRLGGVNMNDMSRYKGLGDIGLGMDDQARYLATSARGYGQIGLSQKDRIDLDIAAVDGRIRDINRSLAAAGSRSDGGYRGGLHSNEGSVVFVRNLPFAATWQQLSDEFSKVGKVVFARIKTENGRSKGYGRVRFETSAEANLAVKHFDGLVFDGRKIEVSIDSSDYV